MALIVVLTISVVALYNSSFIEERPSIGESPEQIFVKNVAKLEDGELVELKELAAFDWDVMYIITPYSDAQWVNERHSLNIRSSPVHFNTDLLFIKDDELVARIFGGHRESFRIFLPIDPLIYYYSESYYFSVQKTGSLVVLYRGDPPGAR